MKISDLCREANKIAKEKGWWDKDRNPLEILMLINCELAEAAEEFRKDTPPAYMGELFVVEREKEQTTFAPKPEGWLVELADVYIRIADLIGQKNLIVEFEEVLNAKIEYNRSREYRHGNKKY
jgi:hypothetical protein